VLVAFELELGGGFKLELGGGFKLQRFLKPGYAGFFEAREFGVLHRNEAKSVSDSIGRPLNQLMQKKAMSPTHQICQTERQRRYRAMNQYFGWLLSPWAGESEAGHGNLRKVTADHGNTQREGEMLDVN